MRSQRLSKIGELRGAMAPLQNRPERSQPGPAARSRLLPRPHKDLRKPGGRVLPPPSHEAVAYHGLCRQLPTTHSRRPRHATTWKRAKSAGWITPMSLLGMSPGPCDKFC